MNEHFKTQLIDWLKTILYSALLFFGMRVAVVEAYHVPTGSMRPTILEGDRILGTKFHYWFWAPKAGDVVVFKSPERARELSSHPSSTRLVKRVVATEGDTVEVTGGTVLVNGRVRDEPFIQAPPNYELRPIRVPKGHVFVLGDNRNNSLDGHVWGFLEKDALIARAWVRYWPPTRLGAL
ncbi:MAG: signal peptidase I [Gemmatimonadota bacterium]|nr:MAG: signal peptidase I [Gemmatimonadota bacterium]